jgi:glycosyltransferase involved in cell wall biosynthesis
MHERVRPIWIAWERHRRTVELCRHFGIREFLLEGSGPRILKHPIFVLKTWRIIHRERPGKLLVQNPSIVLALLALLLKSIYRYELIVDAHNAAIIPRNHLHEKLRAVYRYIQKKADRTIVTNRNLADIVARNGGRWLVLPDKLPDPGPRNGKPIDGEVNIVYICTFEDDEPFGTVIETAGNFDPTVRFHVTGRKAKCPREILDRAPGNVVFTDFLPDPDYWKLLSSADFIIDLTHREDCLVCGAYEAVASEKPMILTGTGALRSYFNKGAVYTDNSQSSLTAAIRECLKNKPVLSREVKELKTTLQIAWKLQAEELGDILRDAERPLLSICGPARSGSPSPSRWHAICTNRGTVRQDQGEGNRIGPEDSTDRRASANDSLNERSDHAI